MELWKNIQAVRQQSPLVHNITNFVVMNNTANALLAAGASPIMAHASSEVVDMVNLCQTTVINIGTLDEKWFESMFQASVTASRSRKPWVLDPVGAGATPFRNTVLNQLLKSRPSVIRGNASEIMALAKMNTSVTKGVDSTSDTNDAVAAGLWLQKEFGSIVCISGETDIILDGKTQVKIANGHVLMTKVTGLGCTASALVGAFVAANGVNIEAVAAAMALLGVAGELAEKESKGPGSLQVNLLDKLYSLTEEEFLSHVKLS